MRFYKLDIRGKTLLQRLAGAPGYVSADMGRILYDDGQDQLYYGCDDTSVQSYLPLFDAGHDLQPIVGSTYKIGDVGGTFLEIHADDFFGNILSGDGLVTILQNGTDGTDAVFQGTILADNALSVILSNGSDGTDAYIKGDVKAVNGDDIIFSGADRAASWASLASVKATNGSDVLVTDTTPANSTFAGVSTRAKYA